MSVTTSSPVPGVPAAVLVWVGSSSTRAGSQRSTAVVLRTLWRHVHAQVQLRAPLSEPPSHTSNARPAFAATLNKPTSCLRLCCPHSMRSRVHLTVGCPSVRPSVCAVGRQQQRRAAGLLLSAMRAPRTSCRSISAAGARAQQQMRAASC